MNKIHTPLVEDEGIVYAIFYATKYYQRNILYYNK